MPSGLDGSDRRLERKRTHLSSALPTRASPGRSQAYFAEQVEEVDNDGELHHSVSLDVVAKEIGTASFQVVLVCGLVKQQDRTRVSRQQANTSTIYSDTNRRTTRKTRVKKQTAEQ